MSNENNPKLKIISEYFIKPKYNIKQPNQPHYLSTHDLFQLSTCYMQRGLLYAKPPSLSSLDSLVDNLKESMSIALVDFYPLAGRLSTIKYEGEHASWVYVDPDKGPGVTLIHASGTGECKVTVSDIVTCYESSSRFIWSFFDMGEPKVFNQDGHSRPLLSVQVTDLVDGVFIGFTMNHCLGDGTSLWHFITTLSKIFMDQGDEIEKPIFKAVFADGYGPILKLPYLDSSEFVTRFDVDPQSRVRVFHFSGQSIAKLKYQARETNNIDNNNHTISSFQALAAFMWLSVARARNLPGESDMSCWLSADTRPKHDPPLPNTHFGNFVHLIRVTSKMDELMNNGLDWAAMLLHQGVMGFDEKSNRANLKARSESPDVAPIMKLRNFFGTNPPLIFSGSMRFDTYGPEFGLGRVVTTRTGYSTWINGRIVIDPGREGGGSVDVQICLASDIMTALESDNEFMAYIS